MNVDTRNGYVVLADVIGSRDIEDREGFRDDLTRTLARVNDAHEAALAAPFERIKGLDEFGGVLAHLPPVAAILDTILNGVHPVGLRLGIASGGIDVGQLQAGVAALDGPAFHRADEAIVDAAEANLYVEVDTGRSADSLVAAALNLLYLARERRTARQIEVIEVYERHGTQVAAADALEIPQQAVSQALHRANYYRVRTIRDRFEHGAASIYD